MNTEPAATLAERVTEKPPNSVTAGDDSGSGAALTIEMIQANVMAVSENLSVPTTTDDHKKIGFLSPEEYEELSALMTVLQPLLQAHQKRTHYSEHVRYAVCRVGFLVQKQSIDSVISFFCDHALPYDLYSEHSGSTNPGQARGKMIEILRMEEELSRLERNLKVPKRIKGHRRSYDNATKQAIVRIGFLLKALGGRTIISFLRSIDVDQAMYDQLKKKFDGTKPIPANALTDSKDPSADQKGSIEKSTIQEPFAAKENTTPDWISNDLQRRARLLIPNVEEQERAARVLHEVGLIIGNDKGMQQMWQDVCRASRRDQNVLLRGDTGVGKERVFEAIHLLHRKTDDAKSHCINGSAIGEGIAESEFFGHEKGAFSGADRQRTDGAFQVVKDGGTLFIDEIGDMPLPLQAKLLRVLQERTFHSAGSGTPISLNGVKIVAATHQPLEQLIATRKFRLDLYERLAQDEIYLPSLDECSSEHRTALIGKRIEELSKSCRQFCMTEEAHVLFQKLQYPGNVRGLFAHLDRAADLAGGNRDEKVWIEEEHVQATIRKDLRPVTPDGMTSHFDGALRLGSAENGTIEAQIVVPNIRHTQKEIVEAIELVIVQAKLKLTGNNQRKAANELGINRNTLHFHMTGVWPKRKRKRNDASGEDTDS